MNGNLLQAVVLSLWLGAAALFATSVAPAAFAVLPSRSLAGALVGRVLPAIFYSGMLTGAIVAALAWTGRAGGAWRGRGAMALLIVVACAIGQFVVGARIEAIRVGVGGSIETLSADDPQRLAFGRLHGVSVGLMGLAMLAAFVAIILASRAVRARD